MLSIWIQFRTCLKATLIYSSFFNDIEMHLLENMLNMSISFYQVSIYLLLVLWEILMLISDHVLSLMVLS